MSKKLAIVQSNYIPWKGYFDLIGAVDEFILYDVVQFTKNDWRNRNQIKTSRGLEWLSVPVGQTISRSICEVVIKTHDWQEKHWHKVEESYHKAPYFSEISSWLRPLYMEKQYDNLSAMNREFIVAINAYLGIHTLISDARDYMLIEGKTERLISLCEQAGATSYLSGPAAKDYLDVQQFTGSGISVEWFSYAGYPEYSQLHGAFVPNVSIVDLLMNCGKHAPKFMLCERL